MKSPLKSSNNRRRVLLLTGIVMAGILLVSRGCTPQQDMQEEQDAHGTPMPGVLIVTSGISDEEPRLAAGIVAAIQSFNKRGVPVRLEPRDILYDFERMSRFTVIILSTFPGYHDADRKYSLSYMSDEEVANIERFVREGGVLIAGDNTGRNYPDGTDRITLFDELTPDNWLLSACYGVTMTERNILGFGFPDKEPGGMESDLASGEGTGIMQDLWALVPDRTISDEQDTLLSMQREDESIPGVLKNRYEDGLVYFLAASGFLQPVNEGGYWSIDRIDRFYGRVLDDYERLHEIQCRVNPWPGGARRAFSVSLNAEGDEGQFKRIFSLLKDEGITPTVFVTGRMDRQTREYLQQLGPPLASSGYTFTRFNELTYPTASEDILRNQSAWDTRFKGFRFPFTQPGFWGMMALEANGYRYESSIGANNLDFIHGAVAPHNLVVANDGYYRRLDLLEISPTYHDDYYFLSRIDTDPTPDSLELDKDVRIYRAYLSDFWEYAVKPYDGIMVFLGHPRYVGNSDATLMALSGLIGIVKEDSAWVATLDEVALFRNALGSMQFFYDKIPGGFRVRIIAPKDLILKDVCLNVMGDVRSATARGGNVEFDNNPGRNIVVFDAFDGQSVTVKLE